MPNSTALAGREGETMTSLQDQNKRPVPAYALRIPATKAGWKLLEGVRAHANRDGYKLRTLYNGPREKLAMTTRKGDATGIRVYFDRRPTHPDVESASKSFVEAAELRREARESKATAVRLAERATHAESRLHETTTLAKRLNGELRDAKSLVQNRERTLDELTKSAKHDARMARRWFKIAAVCPAVFTLFGLACGWLIVSSY